MYGLDTDFPGYSQSLKEPDIYSRAAAIENSLHAAIVNAIGCHPERFIPHIQPYEFEGLLFSTSGRLGSD
ncbi:hypothetical protein [Chitinimonas sp. BJB300]|uniref:hypothetical protein n=1 Tax=Chitinimonas sp. BJB300 TaxID=1559339 RepID=UPI000C122E59